MTEIILIIVLVVTVIVFFTTIFTVKQKSLAIIELFGKFYTIKQAGLRMKIPAPLAVVAGVISLKLQEFKQIIEVKTKDNAFLSFPVTVQYRVIEEKAKEAFYELSDPVEQIVSYILNHIRSRAAQMDLDALYTNKDEISKYVQEELKQDLAAFGYEVVQVLIDQPMPSPEVAKAFNRVIAAQREKEAAYAEADALKVKLVGEAQAEAESLKLKAQAYVDQRKVLATGISVAMKDLRDGLKDVSDNEILSYFAGIDYRDTIREASKNPGSVIITPMNATPFSDIIAANKASK
jgi:regulator of protease activity HflC (stomatin/prohibitin superfamily)